MLVRADEVEEDILQASELASPARARNSSSVPSAMSVPCEMMPMRVQSRSTTSMMCELKKIVVPVRREVAQDVADDARADRIDALERLVEEEHLWPVDQRGGQRDLLAHADGVVHDELVGVLLQAERLQQRGGAALGSRRAAGCRAARRTRSTRARSAARRG